MSIIAMQVPRGLALVVVGAAVVMIARAGPGGALVVVGLEAGPGPSWGARAGALELAQRPPAGRVDGGALGWRHPARCILRGSG